MKIYITYLNVKEVIDDGISKGTIKPDEEVFLLWKVDKFQYTDGGITEVRIMNISLNHHGFTIFMLIDRLRKSNEYISALEHLTTVFEKGDVSSNALKYFVKEVINKYLYNLNNPKFEEGEIDDLIKIFLKDLREEPVKCGAIVELVGIILRPDKVELSDEITLRKTRSEDLEIESPLDSLILPTSLLSIHTPSVILEIEFSERGANGIQRRVEQSIAILRLFKFGSVKLIRYRMYSESITDFMTHRIISSTGIGSVLERYLVTEEDVPKLKNLASN